MADHGTGTNNRGNTQTLSTAAAEVFATGREGTRSNPRSVAIQNIDASINVFIGFGSDLTTSNGWRLLPGEAWYGDLKWYDSVWAIGASGTPEIRWLAMGQTV